MDLHQPLFRFRLGRGAADHADHFVDVGVGQQQPFDRVFALPRPGQQELRAPADDRFAVADELLQHLLERQHPRLAVDQRQEDQRETVLQRRELVELVQHDVGIGIAFQFADQADRLFQIAFVANARNAGDFALVHQGGDAFFDAVAGLLEGDFADDDAVALVVFFDRRPGADDDRASAGVVSAADAGPAADDAAGGKVGAGADFHQFVDRDVGIVDHADQGVADFAEVVRRDRRGHAHRDAVGAVDQQIRELRRQHRRLGPPLVVGRQEIDRVELDVLHHQRGDRPTCGLRCTAWRPAGRPAIEPKLPCLSISTCRMFHSWAMRTSVG